MAVYEKIVLAPVIVVSVLCLFIVVGRTKPDITPIFYNCRGVVDPLSPYQDAIQIVLDDLKENTANRNFNYYNWVNVGGAQCFGHALCNRNMPAEDCETCLIVAEGLLKHTCQFPGVAGLVLRDCGLSWQQDPF